MRIKTTIYSIEKINNEWIIHYIHMPSREDIKEAEEKVKELTNENNYNK